MAEKLGRGRKAQPAGTGGDGRPITTRDNARTPEAVAAEREAKAKELEEAKAVQLISVTHKIRTQKAKTDVARAALKEQQAVETELYRLAKVSGFTRDEIDEDLTDLNMNTKEFIEKERQRTWRKLRQGLADPTEKTLFTGPEEVRDEAYWRAEGYRVGLAWGEPKPPKECHVRFQPTFMAGYHDGAKVINDSVAAAAALSAAPSSPEAEPEPEPEFDPDAEAKKLKAAGFTAPDAEVVIADDFEATPEELARQTARPKPVDEEAV